MFLKILFFLENSANLKDAKEFEKQGVGLAESGNIDKAIEMFDKAISLSPMWASAYNNRAQALRILKRNEGNIFIIH